MPLQWPIRSQRLREHLLTAMLAFVFSQPALALDSDRPKPVCLVSFLFKSAEHERLMEELTTATGRSFDELQNLIEFLGPSPKDLRRCLESGSETTVIVAHSLSGFGGTTSMVYPTAMAGGVQSFDFIPDAIFRNVQPSSQLKRVLVATCNAESLSTNYPHLFGLADKMDLQFAEADMIEHQPDGIRALRSFGSAAKLIAAALAVRPFFDLGGESLRSYYGNP